METNRSEWSVPRLAISSDHTLVSAAVGTMKFANIPTYAYKPSRTQNAIEIAFAMNADAAACVAHVYAARENGDIAEIWTGTLTAGNVENTDDDYWVDTFASTTDTWITTIKELDAAGNNGMSRIIFDSCGYRYFFVQFTGLAAETVRAFYSGF